MTTQINEDIKILNDKIDLIAEQARTIEAGEQGSDLDLIQILRMISETAESALRQAVPVARSHSSWEQVGKALGTTRQAAHERFGSLTT